MPVPLSVVDAFTDTPFGGNPAGVCLLDGPALEAWMAAVAREVNLSETAFAWPVGPGRWGLRWWTPLVEVPLCGHATLATAHVLLEGAPTAGPDGGDGAPVSFTFETASGELTARSCGDDIGLDLPASDRRPLTADAEAAVRAVLGTPADEVVGYGRAVLAAVADRAAVEAVRPDLAALARLPSDGLIVTAADGGAGYVLRYFAPGIGIDEDPVTGAAQCAAGPYWRDRTGAGTFAVEQLSARRGRLTVTVTGDGRVGIAGRAVTVLRGTLTVDPPPVDPPPVDPPPADAPTADPAADAGRSGSGPTGSGSAGSAG